MPQYTPPLRDMHFLLHEVFDAVATLKTLPAHAEIDADTLNAVLEEGGKFAAQAVGDLVRRSGSPRQVSRSRSFSPSQLRLTIASHVCHKTNYASFVRQFQPKGRSGG